MRSHSIVKRFVNSMSKITERTHVKKEDEAEVNSVIKAIVKELALSIRDAGVEDTFGKEISTKAELRKATEEAAKDAVLAAFDDIDLMYADRLVKNYLDNKGGISYINRVSGLTESRRVVENNEFGTMEQHVEDIIQDIREVGVKEVFGKEHPTQREVWRFVYNSVKEVIDDMDDASFTKVESQILKSDFLPLVMDAIRLENSKKVKESRSRFRKTRLKEWNDNNDPPKGYWGKDSDSIDSAIADVIKIYNVDGLLGDGDNVSSAYEAALEGEEDVAITRAEIIGELKWDIAHEASKFVDDEDEIEPSDVSDEDIAPLVAEIIKKLKKAGVLVESRSHKGRIVESEEDKLEDFRSEYTTEMHDAVVDICEFGFLGGTRGEYNEAIDKAGKKGFEKEFKKLWTRTAKDGIRKAGLEGVVSPEDEYKEAVRLLDVHYQDGTLSEIFEKGMAEDGVEVKESRSRFRKSRITEARSTASDFESEVQQDVYEVYKELKKCGLEVGLDGKYKKTTRAKFASALRKEFIKNAEELKSFDEAYSSDKTANPTKAVDDAIETLNWENRYWGLEGLYDEAKDVDKRQKKGVKESRFRRSRIAEGKDISMSTARELSTNRYTDTSAEVIWAIYQIAKNEKDVENIWHDPSTAQQKRVLKLAFEQTDEDTLNWGDEYSRDGKVVESRSRRRHLHESASEGEVVDLVIGEIEDLDMADVFFEGSPIKSWNEAKSIIEDYITSLMGPHINYNGDVDLYDAFDEAVKKLGGWEKVKELVKWDKYAKEKDVKESRFRSRRGRLAEADEKEDEKEKLFKKLLEYCEESEFLAEHVIQPYLEENDYPEITVKKARDMIEEYNAFDLDDCYHDIIAAIGDTPEEIGKKVTDTLFTDSDIKEIIDLAWDNIHRHREDAERWDRSYKERMKKSGDVKESRAKTINESSMAGLIRIVNRHKF